MNPGTTNVGMGYGPDESGHYERPGTTNVEAADV